LLGNLDIRLVKLFAAQIVHVLEYMQSKLIMHRDLKPQNLMLDDHYNIKFVSLLRLNTEVKIGSKNTILSLFGGPIFFCSDIKTRLIIDTVSICIIDRLWRRQKRKWRANRGWATV